MQPEPEFDPVPLLEVLETAGVDYVVIGGVAGGLHGSAIGTNDLDVAYARDAGNLDRLATALREVGARLRGRNVPDDLPFLLDARTLERGANFTFVTRFGALDVLSDPAGAPPYARLRADATSYRLGDLSVRAASLDHLIAMKEAAARPKDLVAAMEYRQLSDELRRPQ
jgi:hypothetical protein